MTSQQRADALLRQHQLERILRELELDIATVVTAQYDPAPETETEAEPAAFTLALDWESYLS